MPDEAETSQALIVQLRHICPPACVPLLMRLEAALEREKAERDAQLTELRTNLRDVLVRLEDGETDGGGDQMS